MKIVRLFQNKFLIATIFFVVWMLFFDHNNIFLHLQYRNELSELKKSKEYYKEQIGKTRKEVELLKTDPKWMEKVAREQYLMKRDNEDVSDSMLRYLYNEMSPEESKGFLNMINGNAAMMDQFAELKEGYDVLNSLSYSPSRHSLDRIKTYASIDGMSMQ